MMRNNEIDPFEHPWSLPGLEMAQMADVRWWWQVGVSVLSGWAIGSLWIAGHVAATTLHFILIVGLAPVALLISTRVQWGMRRQYLARMAKAVGPVRRGRLSRMATSYAEWPVFLVDKGISSTWKVRRVHPFVGELAHMGQAQVHQLASQIPPQRAEYYEMMLVRSRLGPEEALRLFSEEYTVPVDNDWERCDPFVRQAVLPPEYRDPALPW